MEVARGNSNVHPRTSHAHDDDDNDNDNDNKYVSKPQPVADLGVMHGGSITRFCAI